MIISKPCTVIPDSGVDDFRSKLRNSKKNWKSIDASIFLSFPSSFEGARIEDIGVQIHGGRGLSLQHGVIFFSLFLYTGIRFTVVCFLSFLRLDLLVMSAFIFFFSWSVMHLMIFIPPYHTRLLFWFWLWSFVPILPLDMNRYQWSAKYHVCDVKLQEY